MRRRFAAGEGFLTGASPLPHELADRMGTNTDEDTAMDLLSLAKNIADRVEAQSARAKVPVAVCVISFSSTA
jgi:hypothetical protein